jgi:hypothetical protein
MGLLDSLIGPATTLASKFIPDKDLAAKLGHELATMSEKMANEQMLAQIEVNKAEAASGSLFKGGGARLIGWICGLALLSLYLSAFSMCSFY